MSAKNPIKKEPKNKSSDEDAPPEIKSTSPTKEILKQMLEQSMKKIESLKKSRGEKFLN